jgi:cellulose synthase/poly-beta-1,6-N-acetylglucosamine synthase-like glycosyltransferase
MDFPVFGGLTAFAWGIAFVWITIVGVFLHACRNRSSLRPLNSSPKSQELPELSVIVAARNESACIETCIRSLFRQDYPALEVVAVNDRSSDDTGSILDRLAAEFGARLQVIHVDSLRSGWFGKPHALDLGMKFANGSMVCFTDADCEFLAPSALRTSVVEMLRGSVDFLSIAAKYTMHSLRECLAVPCCAEALLIWLRPERVSDPRWPDAFANGAFIMVRKQAFESIGGWGSVRMKISEDLELARAAKRAGLQVNVAQGEGFYQTGSYGTLTESWNGWSRIFKGALTPAQLMITLGRMIVLFVIPLCGVLWGLSNAMVTGSTEWLTSAAGLGFTIAFSLRCMMDVALFWLVGAPLASVPLAPVGRLFVMCAVTRALLSHAGLVHTHWRGATFASGQMITSGQVKA